MLSRSTTWDQSAFGTARRLPACRASLRTFSEEEGCTETGNGLIIGQDNNYNGWAFDLNTNTFYSIGPADTQPLGVNTGYVLGLDGNGTNAFILERVEQKPTAPCPTWASPSASPSTHEYVVGENLSGKAALSNISGTQTTTYWSGEVPTAVNNSGIVGGDTATGVTPMDDWNEAVSYNGVAEAYFPGYGTVPLNHYAPNGVSFDFVQAINDAGDILVLSETSSWATSTADAGRTSWCRMPRRSR